MRHEQHYISEIGSKIAGPDPKVRATVIEDEGGTLILDDLAKFDKILDDLEPLLAMLHAGRIAARTVPFVSHT